MTHATPRPRDRILVVDDDAPTRKALGLLLSDDYEVVVTAGPREALLQLERKEFCILITDEQMPDGSGLELLAEVDRRFPLVIGILMTGRGDLPGVRAAMRNVRGATVLLKPCDGDLLLQKVQNAATMARMRRATHRLSSSRSLRPR